MSQSKVTVVIPIYNEQEVIPILVPRLVAVFAGVPEIEFRVIFVNDGSADDSLRLLVEQSAREPRFAVIDLSRNFGHQAAITAGLAHADGDAVVIMDGDLQDPPEVIVDLLRQWQQGAQVVRAERRSRAERGLRSWGFWFFHKFFGWISDFPVPAESGIFGLLDRQALVALRSLPEKNRFFPGLRAWIGFDQRSVFFDRPERPAGAPKQTLRRLARYAMDGVLSFSYKPLRFMMWSGGCISVLGFALAMFFVTRRVLGIETAQTGFTTLVTLMLFLGGIQLVGMGLLGEYLGRIYDEVKHRPLYIIKQCHGFGPQLRAVESDGPQQSITPPRSLDG